MESMIPVSHIITRPGDDYVIHITVVPRRNVDPATLALTDPDHLLSFSNKMTDTQYTHPRKYGKGSRKW